MNTDEAYCKIEAVKALKDLLLTPETCLMGAQPKASFEIALTELTKIISLPLKPVD